MTPRFRLGGVGCLVLAWLATFPVAAQEHTYRVAVIENSPPLSYRDDKGELTGFNVEISREICATLRSRCTLVPVNIDTLIDIVAKGDADFAVAGMVASPERRGRVLFSKPYFQSFSVFLARSGMEPGQAGAKVAVIKGSAQAAFVEKSGWSAVTVSTQAELAPVLRSGAAQASILPMASAVALIREPSVASLQLKSRVLHDPLLSGTLHMPIHPGRPDLVPAIDAAIDVLKRDGRYDQINSRFIPFRMQ